MQRYTLTEIKDASAETKAVYEDYMRTTGATSIPIWLRSLGTSTIEMPYDLNAERLLIRADNALYHSKENGRNCVSSENN